MNQHLGLFRRLANGIDLISGEVQKLYQIIMLEKSMSPGGLKYDPTKAQYLADEENRMDPEIFRRMSSLDSYMLMTRGSLNVLGELIFPETYDPTTSTMLVDFYAGERYIIQRDYTRDLC